MSATSRKTKPAKKPEQAWRLTRYAMSDVALSRVAIFRPMGRGATSRRQTVSEMMKAGGGESIADSIEIVDPQLGKIEVGFTALPMGAREEDLLLVLMALAGMSGTKAAPRNVLGGPRSLADDTKDQQALFSDAVEVLQTEGDALRGCIYMMRAPQTQILSAWLGRRPTGRDYEELTDSLDRLMSITYRVNGLDGNRRWSTGSSGLLTYKIVEDPEATSAGSQPAKGRRPHRNIQISLSERLARVILGWDLPEGAQVKKRGRKPSPGKDVGRFHARVDLDQRFAMSSDLARLVHRYLSSIVSEPRSKPIESKPIKLSTIIRATWGPHPEPAIDARLARRDPAAAEAKRRVERERHLQEIRDRRADLREHAFAAINQLKGWEITTTERSPEDDPAVIVRRSPQRMAPKGGEPTSRRQSQKLLVLDGAPKAKP